MKLLLLGTTGYHPNNQRHTACYMLPSSGVVLDAGSGFFRVGGHLATQELDVFLTHAHLDHIMGLTFLWDVVNGRPLNVRIHGLPDKLAAIDRHLFADELFPARPPLMLCPLVDAVALTDGGRLRWFQLDHPGGSVGFRIDWPDRSMAYVTDTTARPDAAYVEQIRGVDLLVHECYFPDGREEFAVHTGHSCATPVGQVAAAAEVGRLVLVHVDPQVEGPDPIGLAAVRKVFPRAEIGVDGDEVEF